MNWFRIATPFTAWVSSTKLSSPLQRAYYPKGRKTRFQVLTVFFHVLKYVAMLKQEHFSKR